MIDNIADMAVETTENVKMGNEEVRQVSVFCLHFDSLVICNRMSEFTCRPSRTGPVLEHGFYSSL